MPETETETYPKRGSKQTGNARWLNWDHIHQLKKEFKMFTNRFFKLLFAGLILVAVAFLVKGTVARASNVSSVDPAFHTPPMSDYVPPVDYSFHTPPMSDYVPVDNS